VAVVVIGSVNLIQKSSQGRRSALHGIATLSNNFRRQPRPRLRQIFGGAFQFSA